MNILPLQKIVWGFCHFQHCLCHITMGSFKDRGNQYIQLVKVLYCKLPTISKQLSTFLHEVQGLKCRPQRCEASMLPLRHCGPCMYCYSSSGGHRGRVVTLSPTTSEAGLRFQARPQVGKLIVACCWSAVTVQNPKELYVLVSYI